MHFLSFCPFGPSFPFILAFWAFISFHFGLLDVHVFFYFGLLGLHFLSFWPFGASFPFILAFWAFIFGFWPFRPSFPFILAFWAFISFHFLLAGFATWGPPHKLPKTVRFLIKFKQSLSAARPAAFCNFWLFWPSCPFILAFWAFISFYFGLLRFISFHFGFWAFISFHFGLLGLHFF